MRINLKESEYLEVKINPKKTAVKISIKTKIDDDSFAIISCDIARDGVDSIIAELIKFRSELKNEKV
jgi:hypothetical protein